MKLFLKFLLSVVLLFSGYGRLDANSHQGGLGYHRTNNFVRNDLTVQNIDRSDLAFSTQPYAVRQYDNSAETTDKDNEDDSDDDDDSEDESSSSLSDRTAHNYFTSFLPTVTYGAGRVTNKGRFQHGPVERYSSSRYILYRVFRI